MFPLNKFREECPKDSEKIVELIKELSFGYKNKYLFISKVLKKIW